MADGFDLSLGPQGHSYSDYGSTLSGATTPACPDGVAWEAGTKPTCMVLGPITEDHCANASCHPDATCKNRLNDYTCECNEGFSGDGRNTCNVLPVEDECEIGTHTCAAVGGVCTDTQYSFTCACGHGFVDQYLQNPGTQCESCCQSFEILFDHEQWYVCNDTMSLDMDGKHSYPCQYTLTVDHVEYWEPFATTGYFIQ